MLEETLEMSSSSSSSSSPPWEVLDLVAHHLDPDSLAAASCVSSPGPPPSPPTISGTLSAPPPTLPSPTSAPPPSSPPLPTAVSTPSAASPMIAVAGSHPSHVSPSTTSSSRLKFRTMVAPWWQRYVDIKEEKCWVEMEGLDEMRVTWNVVVEEYKGAFGMMDCEGKGNFVVGLEGWFSKELPAVAGCCWSGGVSGLVADLRLGMREEGGGKGVVEVVSVGVLSVVSWRYVGVEDAPRY